MTGRAVAETCERCEGARVYGRRLCAPCRVADRERAEIEAEYRRRSVGAYYRARPWLHRPPWE